MEDVGRQTPLTPTNKTCRLFEGNHDGEVAPNPVAERWRRRYKADRARDPKQMELPTGDEDAK